ncbi:MAG: hypothetical protein Fur0021_04970 [Candidatus Promineifilaceae bacterium]
MQNFNETPFENMAIEELGIEELESRLEMATVNSAPVEVEVTVTVSW